MDLSKLHTIINPSLSPANRNLEISLTVHNQFDHPVTILAWDSPLDPCCGALGIVEIVDTTTDTPLPIDKILFNRQMPPSPESFVQINSDDGATNVVSVPDVILDSGKDYRIVIKGRWKAVWDDAMEGIDASSLENLTGAFAGEFVADHIIRPGKARVDHAGDF